MQVPTTLVKCCSARRLNFSLNTTFYKAELSEPLEPDRITTIQITTILWVSAFVSDTHLPSPWSETTGASTTARILGTPLRTVFSSRVDELDWVARILEEGRSSGTDLLERPCHMSLFSNFGAGANVTSSGACNDGSAVI